MKVKFIQAIVVLTIVGICIYIFFPRGKTPSVHYHAGFKVFSDGILVDLGAPQYMHLEYCAVDGKEEAQNNKVEKAHLHDGIGDVVHIHSKNVKWIDLFDDINYHFPKERTIQGYRNGRKVEDILHQTVQPNESIIIVVGDRKKISLNDYVTTTHIRDVEQRGENCGKPRL